MQSGLTPIPKASRNENARRGAAVLGRTGAVLPTDSQLGKEPTTGEDDESTQRDRSGAERSDEGRANPQDAAQLARRMTELESLLKQFLVAQQPSINASASA
ncbi:hypothetical protein LTR53_012101 [Teratosphaeriaceae sp. CCFEE 6253]|nr:hypothetical protein LTR53_012101 [Teratosphaeriaceae sp. CCFEE 6253]